MKRIGVGIAGGTGYGAHELLRLLPQHPLVDVITISSRSEVNRNVGDFHTDLRNLSPLKFEESLNFEKLSAYEQQIVFTALPHGASIGFIRELLTANDSVQVIDLSGDLRLRAEQIHAQHYPETEFAAELREQFVFGLTELNRGAIKKGRHIANPGCYPTAASLAAAPLAHHGLIAGPLVVNAASGTSGAGRSPGELLHHPARHASVVAYKALTHRHEAEIHQALGDPDCQTYETMFIPHLLPVSRGIHVTLCTTLSKELSPEEATQLYIEFYKNDYFIRVYDQPPELSDVVGSNFCNVHITTRGKQAVVFAVEDNLVKGMAGQAIQNMNVLLGLEETTGLLQAPMGIV